MASRGCKHVHANGNLCGSPALKNDQFCYFHTAQRDRRLRIQACARGAKSLQLPLLEDSDAVQIAIMDVANAYLADRIEHKKASLILKALQSAAANSRRLTFGRQRSVFKTYNAEDYFDHDNTCAEAEARKNPAEEAGANSAADIAPASVADLPPRLDAASESCDPESVHQDEFGGVTVG